MDYPLRHLRCRHFQMNQMLSTIHRHYRHTSVKHSSHLLKKTVTLKTAVAAFIFCGSCVHEKLNRKQVSVNTLTFVIQINVESGRLTGVTGSQRKSFTLADTSADTSADIFNIFSPTIFLSHCVVLFFAFSCLSCVYLFMCCYIYCCRWFFFLSHLSHTN